MYNKIFNGGLELISFPESRPKPSDFYTLFQTEMLKTIPKQPKYSNTQYPVEFPWSASFSSLGNEVAEEELTSSLRKTRGPSRRKKLRERERERGKICFLHALNKVQKYDVTLPFARLIRFCWPGTGPNRAWSIFWSLFLCVLRNIIISIYLLIYLL